ncbi:MAG: Nif3-like dinuclear metal center hexameric protein [Saprospiraceae bacterium]|nr:Nif3-like dinuclear metal center hexameric protein [Saprospiraceae bacterium]
MEEERLHFKNNIEQMTKIKDLVQFINDIAPYALQENYDNSGLITGNPDAEIAGVLVSLDCTETVIDEAIELGCNVVLSHHPIVFKGLKSLTGKNYVERTVIKAIQNNISILSCHTNLDNILNGVNGKIANKIGLINTQILAPKVGILKKLSFFVPESHLEGVSKAIHEAGAGQIGNYSDCAFRTRGTGTFTPNEKAQPFIGSTQKPSVEEEVKVEVLVPETSVKAVMAALKSSHPYEEVAYFLHALDNDHQAIGAGLVGELTEPMETEMFLDHLKKTMEVAVIKHTSLIHSHISKVALCGGAGSFLTSAAIKSGAQLFISADFKYHEFFDTEERIIIADIGHYESEKYTIDLLIELISNNFTNFALHYTKRNTNPVFYR